MHIEVGNIRLKWIYQNTHNYWSSAKHVSTPNTGTKESFSPNNYQMENITTAHKCTKELTMPQRKRKNDLLNYFFSFKRNKWEIHSSPRIGKNNYLLTTPISIFINQCWILTVTKFQKPKILMYLVVIQ